MKAWFIVNLQGLVAGFVIGWVVFKRPAWAENLINKILINLKLRNAS